jgi:hypothetical protein
MQSALRGQMDAYSLTAPATSSFCSYSFAASETSQTDDSFPILHHFKYCGIGSGWPFSSKLLFILKKKIVFFTLVVKKKKIFWNSYSWAEKKKCQVILHYLGTSHQWALGL